MTGATGYSFTIDNNGISPPADSSGNSTVFTGLTAGTSYNITVTAKNTAGNSSPSELFLITASSNNNMICFKEDTKILTDKGYRQIKDLRNGDMVKTLKGGYKPIIAIGYMPIYNNPVKSKIQNQLYIYQKETFPELTEDLVITGGHCVLVKDFVGQQRSMVQKALGNIFVTEGCYRLPAYLDDRAEIYQMAGPFNVYHLCLETENTNSNHAIYANGILVETCFIKYLKNKALTLL